MRNLHRAAATNRVATAKWVGTAGFWLAIALGQTPAGADDAVGSAQSGPQTVPPESTTSASTSTAHLPVATELPQVAYAYSAHGSSPKTLGIRAFGAGLAARGQDATLGGGGAIWGSPVDRLTVVVEGQRSLSREFAPAAAAIVRLYGRADQGLSLGALGKFKIEGFAGGPSRDEVESELEIGGLASYAANGWHLDLNAIAGRGLGDDGETDAEGRLRAGRDLGSSFRIGIDGQTRARLAGPKYLPNGRTWDFALTGQAMVWADRFFGALTAGPTTMDLVSSNVGWVAAVSVGGVAF